ncbi:COP23 domain-containing protein [Argonema galeatum]|uniref:COP23 domain-containing protein n=1 Tax=Argonema galeatum TaxID=2942762 RepID=UPI002011BB0E|nr:COP23 domain-containing protein [Argonema galeatum]MCL1467613.1 COP23 domain-containing protein [Argonema galeatum A003/A1]
MKFNFTASTLLATLAIFSVVAPKAQAQAVSFECEQSGSDPITWAIRDGNRAPAPLIIWRSTLGDWAPPERCEAVTNQLNSRVTANGGTMRGLAFNAGVVNRQTVVCFTSRSRPVCNSSNMLFTLNARNAQNVGSVLNKLGSVIYSIGQGKPTVNSGGTAVNAEDALGF